MRRIFLWLGWTVLLLSRASAERINQEGRILGPAPVVTNVILFNTAAADTVVSAMQIFPTSNAWNECVSNLPLLANSTAMMAQISSDLATNRRYLIAFQEMNYVLVPDAQPLVPIDFLDYPDESDLNGGTSPYGLYPIPTNLPIEEWPSQTGSQTLAQWQTNNDGSDRHAIMVTPGAGYSRETWMTQLTPSEWQAANGAQFNLNTNGLRPDGWISGDAAGLPMFSALVRYDEAERGMVEHACRIVVKRSRYATYIYPATHFAAPSSNTSTNIPCMGQRIRLKASFVIPTNWPIEEQAILRGMKKYGGLVADNGNFFSISVTPDDRWPANCFNDLTNISLTNFEVVQSTGPTNGPRSPGGPVVNAGPDQSIALGAAAQLAGYVAPAGTNGTLRWKEYAGPGTVNFADPTQTNTTATFSLPGVYTLELSADDGIHSVAYDAVIITVQSGLSLSITNAGTNVILSWTGGTAPYVLQQTAQFPASWSNVVSTSNTNISLPLTNANSSYFRLQSQ